MGMAVDANVLIYERIREELKRGKDLLRATRAGFDRALVVILDCHVTTFITGLVLYNIGVGPVRGFAVTLMVGIVTTVFTQFFVTRLLFHWLLVTKRLVEFRAREVLQNANFNFVRWIKLATTMSIAVIAFGAIYACFVPRETLLGLDFTGGANLQMVLQQPKAADDVRKVLEADKVFAQDFLNPSINTVEAAPDLRSTRFNVRIKLTDSMRHRIEQERLDWAKKRDEARDKGEKAPEKYEPPYVAGLKKIFAQELSPPAYSDAKVVPGIGGVGQAFAQITLHFQAPVEVAAAQKLLSDAKLPHVTVADPEQPTAVESRNLFVQWDVLNTTKEWELFEKVREKLAGLTDRGGHAISPSDPFPESEEIQGRMVGELRNDAIGAIILSWILVALYLRIRFHEYSFGIAAIVSLVHDVGATFAAVVVANHLGLVHAELDLNMIACFLTIIGYSVNDTIVVFDRIRENEQDLARTGGHMPLPALINHSINQTLSRTVLTSGVTMFCVLAQFLVNWGSGSDLESFAFAMVIGIITGTYSSVYIAAPILIWMRKHGAHAPSPPTQQPAVAAPVS
jgi:SecD/SecF fusion protein